MKKVLELIKEIDTCVLEKGSLAFWWLGQIGYAVKLGEVVVYIDAFLSKNPSRNFPTLLKAQELQIQILLSEAMIIRII
jgi:L-ascorbate 6-phosphate lactonase